MTGAEEVLEEFKGRVWELADRPSTRLHGVVKLIADTPSQAFLRGHRERAIAYLAHTFDRPLLRLPATLGGAEWDVRVKVVAGDAGEAVVLAVADEAVFRRFGGLPLHGDLLELAERALRMVDHDEVEALDEECQAKVFRWGRILF